MISMIFFHVTSYHVVAYHIIPYHTISCRTISYHIICNVLINHRIVDEQNEILFHIHRMSINKKNIKCNKKCNLFKDDINIYINSDRSKSV